MRSPRRKRQEEGAVLLEASIVFLQLAVLLLLMVEVAVTFNEAHIGSSVAQQGVRAASAYGRRPEVYTKALEEAVAAGKGKLNPGATLYIYSATTAGLPTGGTCTTKCRAYTWNGSAFVSSGGSGWAWSAQIVCPASQTERVGVMVVQEHKSLTGLIPDGAFSVKEKSVARFEARTDVC